MNYEHQCCLEGQLLNQMHSNGIEPNPNELFNLDGNLHAQRPIKEHGAFVCYKGWEGVFENDESWAVVYYWQSTGGKIFIFSSHPELEPEEKTEKHILAKIYQANENMKQASVKA